MTQPHPDTERRLGRYSTTAIVVANMIGAGIFTTSGIMAGQLPASGWVLLCWILGGMIALAGALCYAELATRMPEVGGEYFYLKTLFHPALGWLSGWTSFFVGFSAPIAASAIGFAAYLLAGLLNLVPAWQFLNSAWVQPTMATIIIAIFTAIHYVGLKVGAAVQNVLTIIKILIVLGLSVLGWIGSSMHPITFSTVTTPATGTLLGFGTAMMLVMFSFSGWNASSYIAGEVKNPRKNLPFSLIAGTLVVMLLYLMVNIFIFQSAPYEVLQGKIAVAETALQHSVGPVITKWLSVLVSLALLSSLSAFILIGPRVYYAMAKDRLFFAYAAQIHSKYKVPSRSILIQGLAAIVMVHLGTFEQLLIYIGFALGIFPWLAILGLFKARKMGIGDETAVKTLGFPYTPLFYLFASLTLLIVAFINRPLESSAALITITLGLVFYYFWQRKTRAT